MPTELPTSGRRRPGPGLDPARGLALPALASIRAAAGRWRPWPRPCRPWRSRRRPRSGRRRWPRSGPRPGAGGAGLDPAGAGGGRQEKGGPARTRAAAQWDPRGEGGPRAPRPRLGVGVCQRLVAEFSQPRCRAAAGKGNAAAGRPRRPGANAVRRPDRGQRQAARCRQMPPGARWAVPGRPRRHGSALPACRPLRVAPLAREAAAAAWPAALAAGGRTKAAHPETAGGLNGTRDGGRGPRPRCARLKAGVREAPFAEFSQPRCRAVSRGREAASRGERRSPCRRRPWPPPRAADLLARWIRNRYVLCSMPPGRLDVEASRGAATQQKAGRQ